VPTTAAVTTVAVTDAVTTVATTAAVTTVAATEAVTGESPATTLALTEGATTTTADPGPIGNPLQKEPISERETNASARLPLALMGDRLQHGLMKAIEASPKDGKNFKGVQCSNGTIDTSKVESYERYTGRAADNNCDYARGMDGQAAGTIGARYKVRAVAHLFGMTKGTAVLDWGAGCGHTLDILGDELGVKGVAIDVVAENAAWAKKNLAHLEEFCAVEGSSIPFADETFDFVLGNGAIHHLQRKDRCSAMTDHIFRVLRPGGCIWFGYLGTDTGDYWADYNWTAPDCLGGYDKLGPIQYINEMELFGITEYDRDIAMSMFACKKA
jgi:SAM-dependent methyltransferase